MNELKPCPFCGGEAEERISFREHSSFGDTTVDLCVICPSCDISISSPITLEDKTFDGLINRCNYVRQLWNRRTNNE